MVGAPQRYFCPHTPLTCHTPFRPHPPSPLLACPKKWCHPETKLPRRAGCGHLPAPTEGATSRTTRPTPAARARETLLTTRLQAVGLRRVRPSIHPRARRQGRPLWRTNRNGGQVRKRCCPVLARRIVSANFHQNRPAVEDGASRARRRASDRLMPRPGRPRRLPERGSRGGADKADVRRDNCDDAPA